MAPTDKLRALAAKWREEADGVARDTLASLEDSAWMQRALRECAAELEAALEEVTGGPGIISIGPNCAECCGNCPWSRNGTGVGRGEATDD